MAQHPDSTQNFRNIFLPIASIAETIFTKGKSPGTTAFQQERIFQQRDAQRASEKQAAFQRKIGEAQLKKFERGEAKEAAIDKRLGVFQDPTSTPEIKQQALLDIQVLKGNVGDVLKFEQDQTQQAELRKLQESLSAAPDEDTQDKVIFQMESITEGLTKALVNKRERRLKQLDRNIKNEDSLRKEFSRQSKTFIEVARSFDNIAEVAKNATAAGDMAMIFSFMKMLDPGSTVREGEFATAEQTAGIPDRVINLYNRAITGQRLNPKQRLDFVSQAKTIFVNEKKSNDIVRKSIINIAKDRGLDIEAAIIPFQANTDPATVATDLNKADIEILKDMARKDDPEAIKYLQQEGIQF